MPRTKQENKPKVHRFNLVIPVSLLRRVQQMATKNHRSVTGQILSALEWTTREEVIDEPTAAP